MTALLVVPNTQPHLHSLSVRSEGSRLVVTEGVIVAWEIRPSAYPLGRPVAAVVTGEPEAVMNTTDGRVWPLEGGESFESIEAFAVSRATARRVTP